MTYTFDFISFLLELFKGLYIASSEILDVMRMGFTVGDTHFSVGVIMFGVGFAVYVPLRIFKSILSLN